MKAPVNEQLFRKRVHFGRKLKKTTVFRKVVAVETSRLCVGSPKYTTSGSVLHKHAYVKT